MLLAARLTAWKGQKVLIEAAERLVDRGVEDIAFVLAGDQQGRDGYVRELDALIDEARPQGRSCAAPAIAPTCRPPSWRPRW